MARPGNEEQLEAIYRRIPRIACQGLCVHSCGPLAITPQERLRIIKAVGCAPRADTHTLTCNLLDENGRCRAYAVRPAICRLYGVVSTMPCPHGCKPERMLSLEEQATLLRDLESLGGPFKIDPLGPLAVLNDLRILSKGTP